ncbi:hypothetical protein ASE92_07695 [Pedobacter sp. Leaf41]|uniref:FecR family protein n=1 Tax=Pedobacter sp. Leaf41 TaxID=1736218 RepID=UPI000702D7B2|nr:FecR family protein [Pedobacter sp. Leaf41]KQN36011.1 hypothetical protein ASE92_07695 [Pedobacter sp. Leaf41]
MKDEIWNNIIKRFTDTETINSRQALNSWLEEDSEHQKTFNEVEKIWKMTGQLMPEESEALPQFESEHSSTAPKLTSRSFWQYGLAAASIGALLVLGSLFYRKSIIPQTSTYITQTAAAGKLLEINLPDGSKVNLNAGSSIRYKKDMLKDSSRIIQLSGEAFFDVKHQPSKPFVVESRKIKTVVYGTSFNIRAYQNEKQIQIGVKTGKVGVLKSGSPTSAPIFLLPDHQISFDNQTGQFAAVTNNPNVDAWKRGTLIFDQTPIIEALETIARRFNVNFDTKGYQQSSCKLNATFENKDLKTILKTIQTVMNINIKQIDKTIYVKGGKACNGN